MQYLITGAVIALLAVIGLVIYLTNSGVAKAREERDAAEKALKLANRAIRTARRGLMEIAGQQTGNPVATALETIDQMESLELEEDGRRELS